MTTHSFRTRVRTLGRVVDGIQTIAFFCATRLPTTTIHPRIVHTTPRLTWHDSGELTITFLPAGGGHHLILPLSIATHPKKKRLMVAVRFPRLVAAGLFTEESFRTYFCRPCVVPSSLELEPFRQWTLTLLPLSPMSSTPSATLPDALFPRSPSETVPTPPDATSSAT